MVDWSDCEPGHEWLMLTAGLAGGGRTLVLYQEVHRLSAYNSPRTHRRFLVGVCPARSASYPTLTAPAYTGAPGDATNLLICCENSRSCPQVLSKSGFSDLLSELGKLSPGILSDALALQFEAVSHLPPDEQRVVMEVLEGLIINYQARRWDAARTAVAK